MIVYRPFQPIQAMSFDLDDTLYDNHPLMIQAEDKLSQYLVNQHPNTQKITKKTWREIKFSLLREQPELMSDMGELRRKTLHQGFSQSGYQGSELSDAVMASFDYFYAQRSNFEVDKNICSLLLKLSQRIPLVAITNGNVDLPKIGIADYFSHCFKASLQQPMKPNKLMFDMASDCLGIAHQHILHIGDNLQNDIAGAVNAGMSSAWFACNRKMQMSNERTTVLPHLQLDDLHELVDLLPQP